MVFSYLPENNGKPVFPKGTTLNVRSLPSLQSEPPLFVKKSGEAAGFYTGFAYKKNDSDIPWLLILYPVNGAISSANKAYVREDVIQFPPVTPGNIIAETEKLLKTIIQRDQDLYKQLLTTAELIERSKKKGINTTNQETVFKALVERYKQRQLFLKDLPGAKAVFLQTSNLGLFYNLYKKFSTSLSGLGVIWFIPLAITALSGAAITITLYYILKPKYDTQTKDLEISGKFKQLLDTIPEEDRKEITSDLESQIDKAYNAGKTDQFFGSIFSFGKWFLIIGAIAYGTSKVLESQNKKTVYATV